MNPIDGLSYGFSIALTPMNFLAALSGALLGTAVGVLPGMGPTVVIALLLIPTMGMRPETGMIMLGAIFYGSQYGDSMTAILMNVPSEAPSIVIAMDGYQLTRKGRAGAALATSAVGSFIGATIGLLGLTVLASILSEAALHFGPPEFFDIALIGLLILVRVSGTSMWLGLLPLAIGMVMTTVGMDPVQGTPRFTFGILSLSLGFELIPVAMGIIGMAEMIQIACERQQLPKVASVSLRQLLPSRREWQEAVPAAFRGSILGFLMGLLPGPSLVLSTFASYRLERRLAPNEVGKGSVRAVAGPKAADDGSISGALVPLMALGIPFTAVTAVLFAGLLLHGLQPGPLMMSENPEVFWGLVAAMYIGNLALLILNFPLVGLWVNLLRIPQPLLSAALVILMLIGSYSLRNSELDMIVMLASGVMGYIMKQVGIDRSLVILGLVIGPMLETYSRQSLGMSRGDLTIFVASPICKVLAFLLACVVVYSTVRWLMSLRARHFSTQLDLPEVTPGIGKS